MKTNIGRGDQLFRTVGAIIIFAAGFYFESWFGLFGIIPLVTAYIKFCPVYTLMGVNTQDEEEDDYIPSKKIRKNFHVHPKR